MTKVLDFLKTVSLGLAKIVAIAIISPFMLIYLAGNWIVQGVKRIFNN
jgi:hypothetical protein